ncbi:winged helix-turn-helix transcriptional regulator [Kribbella sp. DT2]|uniref:winged helix-turn-helix transcriptional regulator n=1 Tax=Kribbella sp. DT2 TaxID=3393427 RepID=UPI003CF710B4
MLANRLEYSAENCSIARTLEIVGEKWTLLVLREAFYGVRRFADFLTAIGCARNILSDRLATLVEHDVLERCSYREAGQRERYEYRLTAKGLDLLPAVVALMQWGDRYLADGQRPPVHITHRGCDAPVRAEIVCATGHRDLTAQQTTVSPGPGAIAK